MQQFIAQTLNGLTLAGIIFLVSSGFTLVFGVMRVTNLSHGAVYLLGGYIGYSVITATHNFLAGLAAAALGMGLFGLLVWVPRAAAGTLSAFQQLEFATTLALTAAGWLVADSYRGAPWLAAGARRQRGAAHPPPPRLWRSPATWRSGARLWRSAAQPTPDRRRAG